MGTSTLMPASATPTYEEDGHLNHGTLVWSDTLILLYSSLGTSDRQTANRCNFRSTMCPVLFDAWEQAVGAVVNMSLDLHRNSSTILRSVKAPNYGP